MMLLALPAGVLAEGEAAQPAAMVRLTQTEAGPAALLSFEGHAVDVEKISAKAGAGLL